MKRETLQHPKMLDLCARLECEPPMVIGYLQYLWNFAADYAPQGNIGKLPDGAIARACYWKGDPALFIQALIDSKWLDTDLEHRLLIHDWSDHCERWIKAKLEKLGLPFVVPTVERSAEATVEASPPRDQTKPNQTYPNQTIEPVATDVAVVAGGGHRKRKPRPCAAPVAEPTTGREDADIANLILRDILARQPTRKAPDLTVWTNDVRLMRERDKRTPSAILDLWRRVQASEFWRKNILSPATLREKFDDLDYKLEKSAPKFKGAAEDDPDYTTPRY
jgi:hypothetical protein